MTASSSDALSASEVECVSIDDEALAAMDQASAEYRSRRTAARADERRLRRCDRE